MNPDGGSSRSLRGYHRKWDAFNDKGRPVAPGTYQLSLLALRPLGDPHNPDHWDLWTSGTIKVVWD